MPQKTFWFCCHRSFGKSPNDLGFSAWSRSQERLGLRCGFTCHPRWDCTASLETVVKAFHLWKTSWIVSEERWIPRLPSGSASLSIRGPGSDDDLLPLQRCSRRLWLVLRISEYVSLRNLRRRIPFADSPGPSGTCRPTPAADGKSLRSNPPGAFVESTRHAAASAHATGPTSPAYAFAVSGEQSSNGDSNGAWPVHPKSASAATEKSSAYVLVPCISVLHSHLPHRLQLDTSKADQIFETMPHCCVFSCTSASNACLWRASGLVC